MTQDEQHDRPERTSAEIHGASTPAGANSVRTDDVGALVPARKQTPAQPHKPSIIVDEPRIRRT